MSKVILRTTDYLRDEALDVEGVGTQPGEVGPMSAVVVDQHGRHFVYYCYDETGLPIFREVTVVEAETTWGPQ